ncbi:CU044_2847 family protein [Streptomyces sp. NBC_01481]|uniref:CU044_2847 family protein n=1 Tax=Streptomyces sp. NBC_01481 TaxID=2975869 RepID=UPI00225BCAD9|nr:CU044_2847 family protein [Streptomyces sp. NBC_01481]MCX4585550.1 CU044_2847 family protein [Streptomyces sp. NBC_01481]
MDELGLNTTQVLLPNDAVIEVRNDMGGGESRDVADSTRHFRDVMDSLQGISQGVLNAVRAVNPAEVTVEFGINVSAKAGHLTSLLVSADAAADLKVTLTWRKDEGADGTAPAGAPAG